LEPLAGYITLAEQLWQQPALASAYNFGPQTHEAASVREVVQLAQSTFKNGLVVWGDGSEGLHEGNWLVLEIAKSRRMLDLKPRWSLAEAVQRTMYWYRQQQEGTDARTLCEADIAAYEAINKPDPAS
jgi:CDP-glucose 4,6-dehydratase